MRQDTDQQQRTCLVCDETFTGPWCPNCLHGMPAERLGERKKRTGRLLKWGVASILVTAAIVNAAGNDHGGGKYMAFEMCKGFVKDQLKAPATAKFRNARQGDGEVEITGSGDGPWVVRSTVDSQNGFGALVRSNFRCSVTHTGGDNWQLDEPVIIAEAS